MHIVSGFLKNRILKSPKANSTRPTTALLREAVFNMLQLKIEGALFLDLFAGSGSMGFEAISRGAEMAFFVESSKDAFFCLKKNSEDLGVLKRSHILKTPVFKALESFKKKDQKFDIIYADPPYGETVWRSGKKNLLALEVVKYIFEASLLKNGGLLFVEEGEKSFFDENELKKLPFSEKRKYGNSFLYVFAE